MANEDGHTLDDLFRTHVRRHPASLALVDPANIRAITGKPAQRLSYAQADSRVESLSRLLRQCAVAAGGSVAIQLPNGVDSVIAWLAVSRAGLVPAMVPMLWRRAECVSALSAVHATAILCCGRVGGTDHGQLALQTAAQVFSVRAVLGFGANLSDGIVPIDASDRIPTSASAPAPAQRVAALTFDTGTEGPVPVEHETKHLLAGGLMIASNAGIRPGARLLTTLPISSAAGLSAVLVPWLMCGGTLSFHHPFTPELLVRQAEDSDVIVVPDGIASRLPQAMRGASPQAPENEGEAARTVISVHRSPQRFGSGMPWLEPAIRCVDVLALGESGLLAARRAAHGNPAPWPLRMVSPDDGTEFAELFVTARATLGIRGPLSASEDGDTGYPCRVEPGGIVVTAGRSAIVNVGGYHFAVPWLQGAVRDIDDGGLIAALPHSLTGHRLAGSARNPAAVRAALHDHGHGPLVATAFRDRVPLATAPAETSTRR